MPLRKIGWTYVQYRNWYKNLVKNPGKQNPLSIIEINREYAPIRLAMKLADYKITGRMR